MESKKRANWGVAVPPSVAGAIFSRLPISNLGACRSVCKSWNRLILGYAATATNSSTPKAMIDASNDANPGTFEPCFLNPKIHCFDIDTLGFVASTTLIGPRTEFIRIFNFCNGLIFLDNGGVEIGSQSPGIFNPMTHEFFPVPYHVNIYTGSFDGFGFSPNTKQFKLFLVPGPYPESESDYYMKILRFGTNHNQWIEVSLPFSLSITSQGCYMDGIIYFLGRDDNKYLMTIYALDVDTESFEVVAVLDVGARPGRAFLQLFNGTIYAKFFIHESSQVQIWRMQAKDSWIKEFTVCGDFSRKSFELLKVSGDEKILLKISKDLFWLNKSAGPVFEMCSVEMVNKIKTLTIPSHGRQFYNVCTCLIETLHFGSLSLILAGVSR